MSHHIHFIRNIDGKPVACVAFRGVCKNDNGTLEKIEYHVSVHNPKDKWNRKMARQLAIGRMVESPFTITTDSKMNILGMIDEIVKDIPNRNLPNRLVKVVQANY